MFVLHIDLEVKTGAQEALEKAFRKIFRPAIEAQSGFIAAELLHPAELLDPVNGGLAYCLELAFDQQANQQKWVATDRHQEVWPAIADHCVGFVVKGYNTV